MYYFPKCATKGAFINIIMAWGGVIFLVPPTSVIFYSPYSILVSKRFSCTFCELVSRKIFVWVMPSDAERGKFFLCQIYCGLHKQYLTRNGHQSNIAISRYPKFGFEYPNIPIWKRKYPNIPGKMTHIPRWGRYLQSCQWGFNMGKFKLSQKFIPSGTLWE